MAALPAADEPRAALAERAQADFDRVAQAVAPALPDATRCEQSQAALLPVTPTADLALIHFRIGYCVLANASITHRKDDFVKAAGELEAARKAWPERFAKGTRNKVPEPAPSAFGVLESIARLEAGVDHEGREQARHEISAAIEAPVCPASLPPVAACKALLQTGRLWLGWTALERDDLSEAARNFLRVPDSSWLPWTSGKIAFRYGNYEEAEKQYRRAAELRKLARNEAEATLAERLAPPLDLSRVLTDWGGAQLLSGDVTGSIATLNAAVKADPQRAQAWYLRARSEELAGQAEQSLADYNFASRTALAGAHELASGEAHFYRGILLYRRKDYEHAENEFSSALNFEISDALRPDAVAWRHLAGVAAGSCRVARPSLELSLAAVSPYFPKTEARTMAATCPLTGSGI